MGSQPSILKTLRAVVLDHAGAALPDLAAMARDLGGVVHVSADLLARRLAHWPDAETGRLGRWQLVRRSEPPISLLLMAWPANHATRPIEHQGHWGLEMTLSGALELQTLDRDALTGRLGLVRRDWLGPGDASWFEADPPLARLYRNLSQQARALTLHVYGGDLDRGLARLADSPRAAPRQPPTHTAAMHFGG